MRYASVCDGIGAAHQAWKPLGWKCAWTSEIEPFPIAVVAQRHGFPNLGDMTKITDEEIARHGPIELLVGGTPCQSFSVAGLRKGLLDPRGNLALAFLALVQRTGAEWVVWENVPGVLSATSHEAPDPRLPDLDGDDGPRDGEEVVEVYDADEDHAFACFLGGLQELGYGFAYGSLDAQFFGLAQRRERVFVVAHLGDWRAPASILLEPSCLRGDSPPSREARQGAAQGAALGAPARGGANVARDDDVARSLRAQSQSSHRADSDNFVIAPPLTTRTGTGTGTGTGNNGMDELVVPCEFAYPIQEVGKRESKEQHGVGMGVSSDDEPMYTLQAGAQHGVAHSLRGEGFDASEDGTGRGTPLVAQEAMAFNWQSGGDARIGGTVGRTDALQRSQTPAVMAFDTTQVTSKANRSVPVPGDPCHPLAAGAHAPAIAFTSKDSGSDAGEDLSPTLRSMGHDASHANGGGQVATTDGVMVRRLTPRECERLQGFPDDYTLVRYRGKPAADGPRYKALGNSMAVPVMAWLGRRIDMVQA